MVDGHKLILRTSIAPWNRTKVQRNPDMPDVLQTSLATSSRNIGYLHTKTPSSFSNLNLDRANARNPNTVSLCSIKFHRGGKIRALAKCEQDEGSALSIGDSPVSINLHPISGEGQFEEVVSGESVIILWMAMWCRKCIFLKPKLEKLAADYYPSVRFYSIDVNNCPHRLVVRAGITKMPTIQLWKNGEKHGEVIGGHKAHLVVNEVREMIESEGNG